MPLSPIPRGSVPDPVYDRLWNPIVSGDGLAWAQQIAAALATIHTPDPDHERPQPLVYCDLNMTPHGTRAGSRA